MYLLLFIANYGLLDTQYHLLHTLLIVAITSNILHSARLQTNHHDRNEARTCVLGRRPPFGQNERTAYHNQSGAVRTISTRDVLQRKLRYVGV